MTRLKKLPNKFPQENGFTLVGVLLVIVLISILSVSIIGITTTSLHTSQTERQDQSAYYIAEAGLHFELAKTEAAIREIYENTDDENTFFTTLHTRIVGDQQDYTDFEPVFGEIPKAAIKIEQLNETNPREFRMTSTGYISDKKRVLQQGFTIEWVPKSSGKSIIPNWALLVSETIDIPNGRIEGDIGTLRTGAHSVTASGGGSVNGSIYVPYGSEHHAIYKPDWMTSFPDATGADLDATLPSLPRFPDIPHYPISPERSIIVQEWYQDGTYDLTTSETFDEIRLGSNRTLTINVGNTDKEIVVDNLNVINGHIQLLGTGKLTIYTNHIVMGSGSTINNQGDVNQVNIFLSGSDNPSNPKQFTLGGAQKIYGSLYAEDANIDLGAGGGIKGNIFTGGTSFKVSGGSWATSPLILAPNAVFEHTNGTIKGTVICKVYNMSGGANLSYGEMQFVEGPISVEGIEKEYGNTAPTGQPIIMKKPLSEQ